MAINTTGALGGAASGAYIGSVVPGIGTAVGAIGGGLLGAFSGGGKSGGGGGKGDDDAPTPPSFSQASQEAVQSQINNLPAILQAYQQYAPEFLKQQIDLEAQYGAQLAGSTRDQQAILAPERVVAQKLLESYFGNEAGLSPTETSLIQENSRAAQSARGLAETGFGAIEEVRALADVRSQIRQQQLQLASASAARVPTSPIFSTTVPQVAQNVDPANAFGLTSNTYGTQASLFGQQKQNSADILGGIISAAGTLGGQYMAGQSGAKSTQSLLDFLNKGSSTAIQ